MFVFANVVYVQELGILSSLQTVFHFGKSAWHYEKCNAAAAAAVTASVFFYSHSAPGCVCVCAALVLSRMNTLYSSMK